jgi:OmpA-OmpF porin, OOP family
MPTKQCLVLIAITTLLFSTSSAIADNEWYGAINTGLNFQSDQESTGPGRVVELDFDTGGLFGGQLGYKFPETRMGRFRAEAEMSYRKNDVDEIVFNGIERFGGGEEEVLAGLMNLFYDFNGFSKNFKPFIGAGIGIANIDADVSYAGAFIDDDDTTFAYQAMIGAELKLTNEFSLVGDARYFALDDPELTRFGGPAPAAFVDLDSEYDSFSTTIGLRYNF